MATSDKDPRSVMSRGKGDGRVATGARVVKHRRWTSMASHREKWPENLDEAVDSTKPSVKHHQKRRHTAVKFDNPQRKPTFPPPDEKARASSPESAYGRDVDEWNERSLDAKNNTG